MLNEQKGWKARQEAARKRNADGERRHEIRAQRATVVGKTFVENDIIKPTPPNVSNRDEVIVSTDDQSPLKAHNFDEDQFDPTVDVKPETKPVTTKPGRKPKE